jgi:hypothetical protein
MLSFARRLVAIIVAISLPGGCTGYKRVSLTARPPSSGVIVAQVAVGDTLRVETTDGVQHEVRVEAIDDDALVGALGERLAFADIAFIERKSLNVGKTVFVVLGTFGICMLAFAVALAASGPM